MTQKELGYVELEWTCKRCGTINPGLKRYCTNCGAPMTKDDQYELPDQQQLITDQAKLDEAAKGPAIQCPYCNTYNPAGTKLCIQCGGDIQAGLARQAGGVLGAYDATAAPDKPCPFCGQPVKAGAQRCPNCGGNLIQAAAQPIPATQATKKFPVWLIIGGIVLGVLCLGSVIAFAIMGSRTHELTGTVTDRHWELSIEILAKQPVEKKAWENEVPSGAQNITCKDEYKETSTIPVPNATEVCGTPYTMDTGSGAGKVVQDCEYRVYASYCSYSIQDWVVINTVAAQGSDGSPQWPATNLQAGQQEGSRQEAYRVTFEADGQTYAYSAHDLAEYTQLDPGSQWVLNINAFGQVKDIQSK